MSDHTKIEWTDATVNFWWGCTKVGPGCDGCYAEAWDRRAGGAHWGQGVPRRKIKSAVKTLHRLDNGYSWWAADHAIGKINPTLHRRVFLQSMSDLFDLEVPLDWFREAWETIEACDRLALQILTKRISAVEKRLAAIGRTAWPQHAGLMITVVNQPEADRDVPRLLALKDRLRIPWVGLSCEPLLGPVDLRNCDGIDALTGFVPDHEYPQRSGYLPGRPRLNWIVAGGESGPGARPMHPDWARSLRDQCEAAGVPFFMKQMARKAPIPADLQVREWPNA